ncbi:hypothetical protein GCK32_000716 [Trichostrongylus colubriformis]|uniref:Serpentine receptor class gamma n=1 Tax=Trichostrongylus colubriformis TaxID=6319 RepID=A0AAN8J034_TRICO
MSHNFPQTVAEVSLGAAYIFVVSAIVTSKRKVFKNAFYTLFVATGIADIFAIYISIFFRVVRQNGVGPEIQYLISICVVVSGVTFFGHMIGNLIIAINRYSALCLMKKYDKIWTRKNVGIIVVLQYAAAFTAVSPLIGTKLVYTPNADGTYTFAGLEERADLINKYTAFGVCVTYASASVAVNIRLIMEWHRLSKLGASRYGRQEKGLLFYALFVFASSMLMCAQQFLKVFAIYTGNEKLKLWVSMQWFWINDLMISIPPFFILLLSAELRKVIVGIILCKSCGNSGIATNVTRTSHHSALGRDSSTNVRGTTDIVSTF